LLPLARETSGASKTATGNKSSEIACKNTQPATQSRCDPSQRTSIGESNCNVAPASIGIVAASPPAVFPAPTARAKGTM
jgi:hypothetical protein